jgi:hypothetical protein
MSDSEEDSVGKQLKIVFIGEASVGKVRISLFGGRQRALCDE